MFKQKFLGFTTCAAMIITAVVVPAGVANAAPVVVHDREEFRVALADSSVERIELAAEIFLNATGESYQQARKLTIDLKGHGILGQHYVIGAGNELSIIDTEFDPENPGYVQFNNSLENLAGINTSGATLNVENLSMLIVGKGTAAGIGGENGEDGGTVNIRGRVFLDVRGGEHGGAGIGGGYGGNGGVVNIDATSLTEGPNSFTVQAVGMEGGAGIGGGNTGNGGIVNISNGYTYTYGSPGVSPENVVPSGAGVGGGAGGNGGHLTISGPGQLAGLAMETPGHTTPEMNANIVGEGGVLAGQPRGSFGTLELRDPESTLFIIGELHVPAGTVVTGEGKIRVMDAIPIDVHKVKNEGIIEPFIEDTKLLDTPGEIPVSEVAYSIDYTPVWDASQTLRTRLYAPTLALGARQLPEYLNTKVLFNSKENGNGEVFTRSTQITGDTTVFVHRAFDVKFDTQGRAPAPSQQLIMEGKTATLPRAPEAVDYRFGGWFTNPQGTGPAYNFETPVTANTTLYADWQAAPAPDPGPAPSPAPAPKPDKPAQQKPGPQLVNTGSPDGMRVTLAGLALLLAGLGVTILGRRLTNSKTRR